jgi:hypothetical protein
MDQVTWARKSAGVQSLPENTSTLWRKHFQVGSVEPQIPRLRSG